MAKTIDEILAEEREKQKQKDVSTSVADAKKASVSVKTAPYLEDDKKEAITEQKAPTSTLEGAGAKDIESFKEQLKRKITKGSKSIKIKLGNFAFVIADIERGIYSKFRLNEPLLTPQELEDEYRETYEDTKVIIDNRVAFESPYGDVINLLVIDIPSHFAKRCARYYLTNKKNREGGGSGEGGGGGDEPPAGLTPIEEAQWYAEYGATHGLGGNLAPHQ